MPHAGVLNVSNIDVFVEFNHPMKRGDCLSGILKGQTHLFLAKLTKY